MYSMRYGAFLALWFGFLLIMIIAITAALVWAVRSRQFANQDRARYLPLDSGIQQGRGLNSKEDHGS
jgi:nitrogen fixation-related uncharacterized protein